MPVARAIAILWLACGAALAQEEPDEPVPSAPPYVAPVYRQPYYPVYVPPYYGPPVVYVPAAPKPSRGRFLFGADFAAAYRYALKESFGGFSALIHAGGEVGALGFAGVAHVELGGSRYGLFFSTIDFGFEFSGRIGERLRLGLEPHFGVMVVERSTTNDPFEDLSGFLFGLSGSAALELHRSKHASLHLFVRVGYDFVDTGKMYSYASGADLELGLGVRL